MPKFILRDEAKKEELPVEFWLELRSDSIHLVGRVGGLVKTVITIQSSGSLYRHLSAELPGLNCDSKGRILDSTGG